MSGQLVKRFPFGILFTGNDGLMFRPGDGPFVFELNLRPLPFHNHRPRQPRHVEGEVVDAPQINIARNFSYFEHAQEMFRPGFQNRQMADGVEGFVLDGCLPAALRLTFFEFYHFLHDELPVAGGNLRIAGGDIGAGDLQIHGGLFGRLAFGVEQSNCSGAVIRAEAFLFARHVIVNVVAPAFFTAIEPESLSHTVFRSDEVTTIDFDSVSEQWARYLRYGRSRPDSFLLALLLALACGRFPNPCHTRG